MALILPFVLLLINCIYPVLSMNYTQSCIETSCEYKHGVAYAEGRMEFCRKRSYYPGKNTPWLDVFIRHYKNDKALIVGMLKIRKYHDCSAQHNGRNIVSNWHHFLSFLEFDWTTAWRAGVTQHAGRIFSCRIFFICIFVFVPLIVLGFLFNLAVLQKVNQRSTFPAADYHTAEVWLNILTYFIFILSRLSIPILFGDYNRKFLRFAFSLSIGITLVNQFLLLFLVHLGLSQPLAYKTEKTKSQGILAIVSGVVGVTVVLELAVAILSHLDANFDSKKLLIIHISCSAVFLVIFLVQIGYSLHLVKIWHQHRKEQADKPVITGAIGRKAEVLFIILGLTFFTGVMIFIHEAFTICWYYTFLTSPPLDIEQVNRINSYRGQVKGVMSLSVSLSCTMGIVIHYLISKTYWKVAQQFLPCLKVATLEKSTSEA